MAPEAGGCRYPHYGEDLFASAALRDPFPHYRAIRDLGPVVYLSAVGLPAIGRFDDVQRALRHPQILISGEGIGCNPIINHQTPERGVLTSDGERHRRLRGVIQKPLMPSALKEQRGLLKELIARQIATLVDTGTFDAVPTLARYLPVEAVTELIGLPGKYRDRMLAWAAAFFNFLGPLDVNDMPADKRDDLPLLHEVTQFFATIDPATLAPGSWSSGLFEAVSGGRLSESDARGALRAFVIPSLDTTIYAKGNLLYNLARSPKQFHALREDPALIPGAVIEGVRHSAVVRAFTRMAVDDFTVDGVTIPRGQRVMVMFGSANRDERHYPDPDRFDVTRKPLDQLGWGTGPHMCVGMHLARIEMEVMLEALVEQVGAIEADEPLIGTNDGLYGIDSLPLRLVSPR